jgi:hypothetical protein
MPCDPAECGARAVDTQGAEINISSLPHPQQPGRATRRALAGDEAEPGRQLTAVLDVRRIRDGSQDGGGRERPNTWHGVHPLAHWMRSSQRLELLVIVGRPLLQGEQRLRELPTHLCAQRRELCLFVFNLTHNRGATRGYALGEPTPILAQEPADLMDSGSPGLDEPRSNPMQDLDVLLFQLLNGHTVHGGPRHRFTDGFGIARLVLR